MMEFLQNLNLQDIWTLLISFITLDGTLILGLIIAWAKGKIKTSMQIDAIREEARSEGDIVVKECVAALGKVSEMIKSLEIRVNDAIKASSDSEKKELEEQSLKLTEAISTAKNTTINLSEEISKL